MHSYEVHPVYHNYAFILHRGRGSNADVVHSDNDLNESRFADDYKR